MITSSPSAAPGQSIALLNQMNPSSLDHPNQETTLACLVLEFLHMPSMPSIYCTYDPSTGALPPKSSNPVRLTVDMPTGLKAEVVSAIQFWQ